MKTILILLTLLAVIAGLVGLQQHPGYVIIHFAQTQVELSFWTAAFSLILAFFITYGCVRILVKLFGLGAYFRKRKKRRRAKQREQCIEQGIIDLLNGRWPSASSLFKKAETLSPEDFVPALLRAISHHLEGDMVQRDLALRTLDTKNDDEQLSLQLAKAQLLMDNQEWESALSCLQLLHTQYPKHAYAGLLLARCCEKLSEWPLLRKIMPNLRKNKLVSEQQLSQWRLSCFCHSLQTAARESVDALVETWKEGQREDRFSLRAKTIYIEGLQNLRAYDKAEDAIFSFLKKQWEPNLCHFFETFPTDKIEDLIPAVDSLCQQHPLDTACQKALGVLCFQSKRYVRAKEILSTVVEEFPDTAALQALADVYMAEGEWQKAAYCLQRIV